MSAESSLRIAGLELTRRLELQSYDAIVPEVWRSERVSPDARSVAVVAHGGRALWAALLRAPERDGSRDPLDRYVARAVREAVPGAVFAAYSETREGAFLPLQRLAETAGFGRMGRFGVLLHPRYGPWCSLRGALFLGLEPEPAPTRVEFAPCEGCPAPCVGADDPRRACVLGREHVYSREQHTHHTRAADAYRKGVP